MPPRRCWPKRACAGKTSRLAGFPGHTVRHEPEAGRTDQIGDGAALARRLGIDAVNDFRSNDVAAGGQGAPLVPLFHAALARRSGLAAPLAVLNLGGVANVTWIGGPADEDLLAFDTGPGCALIDDWVLGRRPAPRSTATAGWRAPARSTARRSKPCWRIPISTLRRPSRWTATHSTRRP